MRKLFLSLAFLGICGLGFGQVSDNAVIPVSVTINSVLRLQVTSGGNIQFVFNTMTEFTSGIANSDRTNTKFNVASSRPYTVAIDTPEDEFLGISTGTSISLGLVQFLIDATGGTGTTTQTSATALADDLTIVTGAAAEANGNYLIKWEAGTGSIKATGKTPDTYVTNVYLTLTPA